ncbi:MAG: hypothetical protein LBC86_10645 [Oscillospiraceae bacterium]|jgi:uncharacterized membrane protein|nr:hypothetical protein [Oscillospiraceae bacterium]
MYCGKCGAQNPDDNCFCGKCGVRCDSNPENSDKNDKRTEFTGNDYSGAFNPSDIETNKVASLLAYPLFFIPLIICPNSKFGRFHANQGLIIFIFSLINSIIQNIFGYWNWGWRWFWDSGRNFNFSPFSIFSNVFGVALLAAVVYGIVNAANGKAVEIPVIGKFRIIT